MLCIFLSLFSPQELLQLQENKSLFMMSIGPPSFQLGTLIRGLVLPQMTQSPSDCEDYKEVVRVFQVLLG